MTRCLLVDEDQEERQALSELLGQYGFDMAETASAEAALKHCRVNSPDIVVTADRMLQARQNALSQASRNPAQAQELMKIADNAKAEIENARKMLDHYGASSPRPSTYDPALVPKVGTGAPDVPKIRMGRPDDVTLP